MGRDLSEAGMNGNVIVLFAFLFLVVFIQSTSAIYFCCCVWAPSSPFVLLEYYTMKRDVSIDGTCSYNAMKITFRKIGNIV